MKRGPYTNQIVTTTPTHNTILQDVKPDGTDATSIKIIILECTMTVTLLIPKITLTICEMPTTYVHYGGPQVTVDRSIDRLC